MKKNVFLMMLSILIGGSVYGAIEEMTPKQVYQEVSTGQAVILDVNPEVIYKKHHVPKALNINFDNIVKSLPSDKSKKLIFYCMNEMCTASHYAAEQAVKSGYKNVARMPSGISGWLKAGLPVN